MSTVCLLAFEFGLHLAGRCQRLAADGKRSQEGCFGFLKLPRAGLPGWPYRGLSVCSTAVFCVRCFPSRWANSHPNTADITPAPTLPAGRVGKARITLVKVVVDLCEFAGCHAVGFAACWVVCFASLPEMFCQNHHCSRLALSFVSPLAPCVRHGGSIAAFLFVSSVIQTEFWNSGRLPGPVSRGCVVLPQIHRTPAFQSSIIFLACANVLP